MIKRLNKEFNLDVCKHISLKYGSVNKDNPQVVYVTGKCWITPKTEMKYDSVIKSVSKKMEKTVKNFFFDGVNFNDRLIFDFSVNTEGMEPKVKKYLSFDIFLKQNEDNKKALKELKPLMARRVSTISNELVFNLEENNFNVQSEKKTKQ